MDTRQVSGFFGNVSKMTIYRWVKNPASGFPKPFKINQKNYWVRRDIMEFRDLRRAQAQGAAADPRREKNLPQPENAVPAARLDAGAAGAQVPEQETRSPGSEARTMAPAHAAPASARSHAFPPRGQENKSAHTTRCGRKHKTMSSPMRGAR